MSGRRRPAFVGVSALSFSDLRDWQFNVGVRLRPWEVRAILSVDDAFRASIAKQAAETESPPEKPDASPRK